MAIYHLHVKNIGRADGRSAVACAAYRAGETLPNDAEERDSRFGGRRDVLHAEVRLPAGAPAWMQDRATLWNAVERAEKRRDARLAKEIEFALPRELPQALWLTIVRELADAYVSRGHAVDLAIHDDGTQRNPHAHLMLATRLITPAGFGGKIRAADHPGFVGEARALWAGIANVALGKAGSDATIDHRSNAAREIAAVPGQHRGADQHERRARRWERSQMYAPRDIDRAIADIAADPGAVIRYPLLSQREDWPPHIKNAPGVLPEQVRGEERSYWAEVRQRVADRDGTAAFPASQDAIEPDRPFTREGIAGVYEQVRAAELAQGEARRAAFIAAAPAYREMFERLNGEMVRAGILRPEDLRSWEAVSRAFRDEGFDQMLAEARANEARRADPGEPLPAVRTPTREEEQRAMPLPDDTEGNWWRETSASPSYDDTDSREHFYERR